jgi:copper(I)-binding protein
VGELHISGCYLPTPSSSGTAVAYLTISNAGAHPDAIVVVSTNVSRSVQPVIEPERRGAAPTHPMDTAKVPAHGELRFTPGHAHLVLKHLTTRLRPGTQVRMTITFKHAGTVEFAVPVVGVGGTPTASVASSPSGGRRMTPLPERSR